MAAAPPERRRPCEIVSGSPTAEEFHYQYDGGGRLMAATFAMTPAASGYTPSSGQPWYNASELPSSRCRVVYDNDGGDHLANLDYFWDNWDSGIGGYDSTEPYAYSYTYSTGDTTMLKIGASFNELGNAHNETYTYNGSGSEQGSGQKGLDYLTSANYNVGNGSAETWTYDAAGNRLTDSATGSTLWTYDDLNNLLTSPGLTYLNDVLGNRLSNSVTSQTWDQINRMLSFTGSNAVKTSYSYRSDGMRVCKSDTSGNSTSYAYDGEMGFEDVEVGGSNPGTTDYAIGGRGVERLAFTSGSNTSVSYPVFDGHGNMTATISESGSSYSSGNSRSFDAWGNIRNSDSSGDPKGRYCANLGHKADDENGLIYMRARFYDPTSGRFLSEDLDHESTNWYIYAKNDPLSKVDESGRLTNDEWMYLMCIFDIIFGMLLLGVSADYNGIINRLQAILKGYQNLDKISADLLKGIDVVAQKAELENKLNYYGTMKAVTALLGYMMIIEGFLLALDTDTNGAISDPIITIFGG